MRLFTFLGKLKLIKVPKTCRSRSSLGSGGGSVGRAVASDIRGPRFESSHRQKFIYFYWTFVYYQLCIGKTKIKKKWPGMAHFFVTKRSSEQNFNLPKSTYSIGRILKPVWFTCINSLDFVFYVHSFWKLLKFRIFPLNVNILKRFANLMLEPFGNLGLIRLSVYYLTLINF